jgi:hypothetical protein
MMTRTHKIELETLSAVIVAALVSVFFVWHNSQNSQPKFYIASSMPGNASSPTPTVTPSIMPTPQVSTTSQISPDGTKKVIMKVTHNADATQKYEFSTADGSGGNEQPLYTTTLSGSDSISIPFNTWSPDNKFLFLSKNTTDALVFNASGTPFANGDAFLDIADTFQQRAITNTIAAITGWASPTLIIVNTTTPNNTKGSSYWFEVPSKAIIQLSTQF